MNGFTGERRWWSPFGHTATGLTPQNFGFMDPIGGDPLGGGGTGLFACTGACSSTWPPETADGSIDWWGLLEGAWNFYLEFFGPSSRDEEERARQVQLAQSGAVTSGWFILLVVGAIVALVLLTGDGG